MSILLHMLRKEFLQLRRDRRIIGIMFIGPIAQLLLFGYAINLDVNTVPLVVCDNDRSAESRELILRFSNSGYFPIVAYVDRMNDIDRHLESGTASLAVVIPKSFGTHIMRGESAPLQAIIDGSESSAASSGLNYATMIVAGYSQNILLKSFAGRGLGMLRPVTVTPQVRVWYNPELRSRNYLIPGILGMLLLQATVLLTALAIVKEKERGTLEQLIVTPIKPYQIIIGKLTPFLLIGIADIILTIAGVTLLLGVPLRGSVVTLGTLSVLFIFTTLGLGLFISTVSQTQQQAMMTTIFFVIMPMNFLSGFFFPIENMPRVIQWVSYLLPLRYFFEIIRGVILRGVGFRELWSQILALSIFGVAILTLSSLRFRKTLA